MPRFERILRAVLVFSVLGAGLIVGGCTTIKNGEVYDWQGKVVRGDIRIQYVNTPGNSVQHRVSFVRTQQGAFLAETTRLFGVLVPDKIEFADLEIGAIVDVIFERGDSDYNMDEGHYMRIVRLVCKAKDKDCVSAEWSSGRMKQVIDENPGDDKAKYGNSYKRKTTQEEFDKYFKK